MTRRCFFQGVGAAAGGIMFAQRRPEGLPYSPALQDLVRAAEQLRQTCAHPITLRVVIDGRRVHHGAPFPPIAPSEPAAQRGR